MKKLLSAAAVALLSTAGVAHADTFANATIGTTPQWVPFLGTIQVPTGAIYSEIGGVAGNTEAASPTVTNTWLIKGTVTKDCSYYGGNTTSHTLDFGTIGVNTQANTSVNNAFDMVSPAGAVVTSTTAGCNFNNTVTLTKANGAQGLLNSAAGGYDSNEFQANIPYSASAAFQGTTSQSAATAGSLQTVTAATSDGSKVWNGGAWRSAMVLTVAAPTPGKALVAGNYQDTLTVELKAL
jgi:hypothetical protein